MVLQGIKTIAAAFGVTPKVVRAWKRAGAPMRVTGRGDGRRWYARREAVESWLDCA